MKDPLAYINAIKEILNETDNVDDIGPGPNNRSKIPRLNVMPNKMPNNSKMVRYHYLHKNLMTAVELVFLRAMVRLK